MNEDCIPCVVIVFNTHDSKAYEQRISFDMRYIHFKTEDKNELDSLFVKHVRQFFEDCVEEAGNQFRESGNSYPEYREI